MTNQWVRRLARVSLIMALVAAPNLAAAQDDDGADKPDDAKPAEDKT